jgi:uncharacterized membrane protein YgcG
VRAAPSLDLPYAELTALREGAVSLCGARCPSEIEVTMTPVDPSSDARPAPVARLAMPRSAAGSGAEGLVAERLRAREHRIRAIRRRVVAFATALFLASSGGILVQLVTGNDPALAKAAAARAAKVASTTGKSSSSGSSSGASTSGSSTSGASSGSSGSGTATAVTTSAS